MLGIKWRHRKQASSIREQTKVKDILVTNKNKKCTFSGHVLRRRDNRWTTRVTEWQLKSYGRNQGRHRVNWRVKIVHSQNQARVH